MGHLPEFFLPSFGKYSLSLFSVLGKGEAKMNGLEIESSPVSRDVREQTIPKFCDDCCARELLKTVKWERNFHPRQSRGGSR